jgi:hypothetical protein
LHSGKEVYVHSFVCEKWYREQNNGAIKDSYKGKKEYR